MWHALRAELAYSGPYLLGGLGLAFGVVTIVTVVFFVVGADGPPGFAAAGIRGMFLVMAPMIVGFIAQSYRSEERRTRLLLAGPTTPRQLAWATVLLPPALFAIGAVAAALAMAVERAVTGEFALESLHIVGFVAGQMLVYAQMAILAQEATAARRQRRVKATLAGWAGFVVAVLLLAVLYLALAQQALTWMDLVLVHLLVAVATMLASVALYTGRTDFTR